MSASELKTVEAFAKEHNLNIDELLWAMALNDVSLEDLEIN